MARTLDYDIFDALVDRMLRPMDPLGDGNATVCATDPSEARPGRKPAASKSSG